MPIKRVIMILAASMEFDRNYNSEIMRRFSDNTELPAVSKIFINMGVIKM